jgi:hypothetical protein
MVLSSSFSSHEEALADELLGFGMSLTTAALAFVVASSGDGPSAPRRKSVRLTCSAQEHQSADVLGVDQDGGGSTVS